MLAWGWASDRCVAAVVDTDVEGYSELDSATTGAKCFAVYVQQPGDLVVSACVAEG